MFVISEPAQKGKRIALFDNVKFVLILCVVIGHFIDYLTDDIPFFRTLYLYIYLFHMPLFIYISGVFYKCKDTLQKVIKYLLIAFILNVFVFAVQRFTVGGDVEFELFSISGIPWFMVAMAAFEAISYLTRNVNKKFLTAAAFALALIAGYDSSVGDMFCLSRIIVFYPLFLLGTQTPKKKIISVNNNRKNKIIGAAVLVSMFVICCVFREEIYVLRPLLTARHPYADEFAQNGFIIRALCYLIAGVMSYAVISVTPAKPLKWIKNVGANTLQIYFWHRPILYILAALGLTSVCKTTIGAVFYVICAAALTFICSAKIFSFPTKNIMNANLTKSGNRNAKE